MNKRDYQYLMDLKSTTLRENLIQIKYIYIPNTIKSTRSLKYELHFRCVLILSFFIESKKKV